MDDSEEQKILQDLELILEKSTWNRCRICKSMVDESQTFFCNYIFTCPYGEEDGQR